MSKSFFSDIFNLPKLQTPKDILVEFATAIADDSAGVLQVEIIPRSILNNEDLIGFTFAIKSTITGYSYGIFDVFYSVLLYPCIISSQETEIMNELNTDIPFSNQRFLGIPIFGARIEEEIEMHEAVFKILRTKRSIGIMRAIYSQK